MRAATWTVIVAFALLLGMTLHYVLPRSEVVRIIGVTERLETLGWNRFFYAATPSGQDPSDTRDVRMIETIRVDGGELVLRNEDTGWIWPPYFKFDSADMQARARDLISSSETPQWVVVTYYGVRSSFLSIYPNALRFAPADSADMRLVPWTRIIVLLLVAVGGLWLWFVLHRWRDGAADGRVDETAPDTPQRGRFGRMWQRLTAR